MEMLRQRLADIVGQMGQQPAVPEAFNPEGSGYDYQTAQAFGMQPDATGHMGSVAPTSDDERIANDLAGDSYKVLKGRQHPTFDLAAQAEDERGSEIVKRPGGYYSNPKPVDREAQINDLYDNWTEHFKSFIGVDPESIGRNKRNWPLPSPRPNRKPEEWTKEYEKIYGNAPKNPEQATIGVMMFYNTMRHNNKNKKTAEAPDGSLKEMAVAKQFFGGEEERPILTGDTDKQFPNLADVDTARANSGFYDLEYEPFTAGAGKAKVAQPTSTELPGNMKTFLNDFDKVQNKTHRPVSDNNSDQIARSALASRRSAVAALGMKPRDMMLTGNSQYGSTLGANYQTGLGKDSRTKALFARSNAETITHESLHRGIQALREEGLLPNIKGELNLDRGDDDEGEEIVIRRMMERFMGDPEKERRPKELSEALGNSKKMKRVDTYIDLLEKAAAEKVKNNKKGGPR